jgi:hypothetical protein
MIVVTYFPLPRTWFNAFSSVAEGWGAIFQAVVQKTEETSTYIFRTGIVLPIITPWF